MEGESAMARTVSTEGAALATAVDTAIAREAAKGRQSRAAAREARTREAARALVNGGRTATPRKETQVSNAVAPNVAAAAVAQVKASAEAQQVPEGMRRCPGYPTWDLPAHTAPVDAWMRPENRCCRTCNRDMQRARNAARKAQGLPPKWKSSGTRKARTASVTPQASEHLTRLTELLVEARALLDGMLSGELPTHVIPVAEDTTPEPAQDAPAAPLAPEPVVDGTSTQQAELEALAAALEAAGGEGTEAGQAVLKAAADQAALARRKADADRKRAERAAAKGGEGLSHQP